MSILIFIIILVVLIVAHEFGHFIVAKISGMRVDEFGVGFPPRLWGKKMGETEYTVNALPFGGFVKIHGETPEEEGGASTLDPRSFSGKSRVLQGLVIIAGIVFNLLLAWVLISAAYMGGIPGSPENAPAGAHVGQTHLTITEVAPKSPAEVAGLRSGDEITALSTNKDALTQINPTGVIDFIGKHPTNTLTITYQRGSAAPENVTMVPEAGILDHPAIGISMGEIAPIYLPFFSAFKEGAILTAHITQATFFALADFFRSIFIGKADLSAVAGPVGIVSLVGQESALGFVHLLLFTAIISINLALINLIPFPALDGGRLLFIIIEGIIRRPIKPVIANAVNMAGFVALILLMVVITYHDVVVHFFGG